MHTRTHAHTHTHIHTYDLYVCVYISISTCIGGDWAGGQHYRHKTDINIRSLRMYIHIYYHVLSIIASVWKMIIESTVTVTVTDYLF